MVAEERDWVVVEEPREISCLLGTVEVHRIWVYLRLHPPSVSWEAWEEAVGLGSQRSTLLGSYLEG